MPTFERRFPAAPQDAAREQFSCSLKSGSGAAWAHLVGELDLATAPILDEALRAVDADALMIVLDLRDLGFLDCSGMQVIRDASRRLASEGRRLVVVRGPRHIDIVFTLTRKSREIEIVDLGPSEPAVQVLLRLGEAGPGNGNASTNGSRVDQH